jgi:cytochrome P450
VILLKQPESPTDSIPGPRGYPVVGILPDLWKAPLGYLVNARNVYGDVIRLNFGSNRLVLIVHPDHVKYVLQDNNRNFRKGYERVQPLLGNGLVSSEGDFWMRQRRLMQPAFHQPMIAAYSQTMTLATQEMLERWQMAAGGGEPLDMLKEMMRLTQVIIVRTMFSSDIGDRADRIGEAFQAALSHFSVFLISPSGLLDKLPTPGNLRYRQGLSTVDNEVYRLIEERRVSGEDKGDLLSRLVLARDEETGEGMSDRQIRDEVLTMFLAGHETTANALAWTWYLLAQHPDVEARLLAEIDGVLAGRMPAFEDISNLRYTRMVFDEALRLYPPAWMFARVAIEADEIGGHPIPAGTGLMISPYLTHRHPDFWVDPERFDPERFSPEQSAQRPRHAYMPFSYGPRVCIGNNFALTEAVLVLAIVLQRYRLELAPGAKVTPQPLATLKPRPGVPMHLKSRGLNSVSAAD